MDAVKLKNSCICGNTLPYAQCCGPFSGPLEQGGRESPDGAAVFPAIPDRVSFRHDLHDLYMYLFPYRNLYQAYWERLSQESYPHHLLMGDADYGRVVMANFFWDYSVQFSDARPILRAARDVEEKRIRLANDFRQWSLAPLWAWEVLESDGRYARIRLLDSTRVARVGHDGELPGPGRLFAGRVLPYRGGGEGAQVHPAVLVFPHGSEETVRERAREIARSLGLKSGVGLRPDVHCDEWRRHGALMLALWRGLVYDRTVGMPARSMSAPQTFRLPVGDAPGTASAGQAPPAVPSVRVAPAGPAAEAVDSTRATPAREGGLIADRLRQGGAVALDAQRFDLRFRALTLARLEVESPGWLDVTLLDEVYRPYVFRWLADHLDTSTRAAGPTDHARLGKPALPRQGDWIEWARTPHDELGGESPLEASAHDFGRRRLQAVLSRVTFTGDEKSALFRHLGL